MDKQNQQLRQNDAVDQLPEVVDRESNALEPIAYNPLFPWFKAMPKIDIDYQVVEYRMENGQTQIKGRRSQLKDGIFREEKINATAPETLYIETVSQFQRQAQEMMQAMMLPWTAMLNPFLLSQHKSDKEK